MHRMRRRYDHCRRVVGIVSAVIPGIVIARSDAHAYMNAGAGVVILTGAGAQQ
jgi:hypothetical protein